jgi:hypothetical protein
MKPILILLLLFTSISTWAGPRVVGNGFLAGPETSTTRADKIDYQFMFDSKISSSQWCVVDYVNKIESFKADPKIIKSDLHLKKIIFLPVGNVCWDYEYKEKACQPGERLDQLAWTKTDFVQDGIKFDGVLIHKWDATASGYIMKRLQGQWYLFLQHKSDNYIKTGHVTNYYVFQTCVQAVQK